MDEIFIANATYFMFAFFLIYPPTEVVTAGFTIPSIFSSLLGSERLFFIHHHIVRTSLTMGIHSLLPLGYYICMGLCAPSMQLFSGNCSIYWKIYLTCSLLLALTVLSLIYKWKSDFYSSHPLSKELKKFASPQQQQTATSPDSVWKSVASEINIEFRHVDKFSSGTLYNRIYLTENWFIKVNLYSLIVCRHEHTEFELTHSNEIHLTYDGTPSIQYLNIQVKPTHSALFKPFSIFLNSFEYKDFNDKLNSPVKEAANIIIKQSLPDQFLDTVSSIRIKFFS